MARSPYIVVGWDEVEPDGSQCEVCGDFCYLAMFQSFHQPEGHPKIYGDYFLCAACNQFVNDPDDAGEEWKLSFED